MNHESESLFWHSVETFAEGVEVQHIATFGLQTCGIEEDTRDVMARYPDFDHVPVCVEQRIIGMLTISPPPSGTVKTNYRPLDDSMLIAAETPLESSLALFAQEPFYRLIVRGGQIVGIVTRSDLHKLPVRMLAFARAVHFELVMAARIRAHYGDDQDWLEYLTKRERENLDYYYHKLMAKRAELSLLELTTFRQKRLIANGAFGLDPETQAQLKQIEDLRNNVAHPRQYVDSRHALLVFIAAIETASRLTAEWKAYLTP